MKNDPHVTEVSDDGALLSRYRNEIVDLKRRLTEASVSFICIYFNVFLQPCLIYNSTSSPLTCVCVCDLPTGFFSHSDHSDGEEGSLRAAPGKGSAPEGTAGPDQKSDQAAGHQLQPGHSSKGASQNNAAVEAEHSPKYKYCNDYSCFF